MNESSSVRSAYSRSMRLGRKFRLLFSAAMLSTLAAGLAHADVAFDDCNGNGIPDDEEIALGLARDINNNGIPDECEPDLTGTGIPDSWEILVGIEQDCNGNGIPDRIEIENATIDQLDPIEDAELIGWMTTLGATSYLDLNNNGILDECETSCGGFGVPNDVAIALGLEGATDCNMNGIPDVCELGPAGFDGELNLRTSLDFENPVPYRFIDISDNPSPLYRLANLPGDNNLGAFSLPFDVTFLDTTSDTIWITTQGYFTFLDYAGLSYTIDPGNPNIRSTIALNADLVPGANGTIIVDTVMDPEFGEMLVVQYDNFRYWSNQASSSLTFQYRFSLSGNYSDIQVKENNSTGNSYTYYIAGANPPQLNLSVPGSQAYGSVQNEFALSFVNPPVAVFPDCLGTGQWDGCDIFADPSLDMNNNGIPDQCETGCLGLGMPNDLVIANPEEYLDLDSAWVAQLTDWKNQLGAESILDLNNNGIPDVCEADCLGVGVPNDVVVRLGLANDCNFDGIPDECQVEKGVVFFQEDFDGDQLRGDAYLGLWDNALGVTNTCAAAWPGHSSPNALTFNTSNPFGIASDFTRDISPDGDCFVWSAAGEYLVYLEMPETDAGYFILDFNYILDLPVLDDSFQSAAITVGVADESGAFAEYLIAGGTGDFGGYTETSMEFVLPTTTEWDNFRVYLPTLPNGTNFVSVAVVAEFQNSWDEEILGFWIDDITVSTPLECWDCPLVPGSDDDCFFDSDCEETNYFIIQDFDGIDPNNYNPQEIFSDFWFETQVLGVTDQCAAQLEGHSAPNALTLSRFLEGQNGECLYNGTYGDFALEFPLNTSNRQVYVSFNYILDIPVQDESGFRGYIGTERPEFDSSFITLTAPTYENSVSPGRGIALPLANEWTHYGIWVEAVEAAQFLSMGFNMYRLDNIQPEDQGRLGFWIDDIRVTDSIPVCSTVPTRCLFNSLEFLYDFEDVESIFDVNRLSTSNMEIVSEVDANNNVINQFAAWNGNSFGGGIRQSLPGFTYSLRTSYYRMPPAQIAGDLAVSFRYRYVTPSNLGGFLNRNEQEEPTVIGYFAIYLRGFKNGEPVERELLLDVPPLGPPEHLRIQQSAEEWIDFEFVIPPDVRQWDSISLVANSTILDLMSIGRDSHSSGLFHIDDIRFGSRNVECVPLSGDDFCADLDDALASDDPFGTGIPNSCMPDCNGNGIPDAVEIESGLALDLNRDGVPDECQINATIIVDHKVTNNNTPTVTGSFRDTFILFPFAIFDMGDPFATIPASRYTVLGVVNGNVYRGRVSLLPLLTGEEPDPDFFNIAGATYNFSFDVTDPLPDGEYEVYVYVYRQDGRLAELVGLYDGGGSDGPGPQGFGKAQADFGKSAGSKTASNDVRSSMTRGEFSIEQLNQLVNTSRAGTFLGTDSTTLELLIDTQAPIINCPDFVDRQFFEGERVTISDLEGLVLVSDPVWSSDEIDVFFQANYQFPVGKTTVFQVTAIDPAGNVSFCSFPVELEDANSIPNDVEDGAPNEGDANYDGVPDAAQHNVASLPLNMIEDGYVTLAVYPANEVSGSIPTLRNVEVTEDPSGGSLSPQELAQFPLGFISFEVHDIEPGEQVRVEVFFENELPSSVQSWGKWGVRSTFADTSTPRLYSFPFIPSESPLGAEFTGAPVGSGNPQVVLHLRDGGDGDNDLTENGVILDPGGPNVNEPLIVDLLRFEVISSGIGQVVVLEWETDAELDNVGFHIYRAVPNGMGGFTRGERLTGSIIPAEGTPSQGAVYQFTDTVPLGPEDLRFYLLEDVDADGTLTLHGPASTTTAANATTVRDWMLMD